MRQNFPEPHISESALPLPVLSHLQIDPSLQNLVFGTQTALTHWPSEQDCDLLHVSTTDSLPSDPHTFTSGPSQRRAPAAQPWSSSPGDVFDEPLQAESQRARPMIAPAASPMLLPMTDSLTNVPTP
jgi:hypothetical protein